MANIVFQRDDIESLLIGLLVYGTGGGGSDKRGRNMMHNDLNLGRRLEIVDVNEIEDDAFICSGGNMGSVKTTHGIDYEKQVKEWEHNFPLLNALKMTEEFHKKKLNYLVPFELGGGNTPIILSAAARMGIPALDADLVGRAAPETQMAAPIGLGVSLYPMGLVDDSDNSYFIVKSPENTTADEVGRVLIGRAGKCGANTHYAMSGKQAKETIVAGSVSRAFELGKALLLANEKHEDGVALVCRMTQSDLVFQGRIKTFEGIERGGFYQTSAILEGTEGFAGHTAQMIIKNELMLLYVDGILRIMFPDYGYIVEPGTGFAIPSAVLGEGVDVALLGAPCHPRVQAALKSPEGLAAFGPCRYGYGDMDYIPYETLNR